jgi:AraC family ethanolamine operon transcriptional activator
MSMKEMKIGGADLLVRSLVPGLGSARRVRSTRCRRLVDEAVALARDSARNIHTVAELSRLSGASDRTLRRGFRERFETSPKAYLQAQRLIGVRRRLRATGAEVPISDIANEWGFWHMGQFAADYRRQFSELPSETARRDAGP